MSKFAATEEQRYSVELMSGIGIRQEDIASALKISQPTLRMHFGEELASGKTKTITKVADSLVRQALAGNITAAIFYLKTQARWSESDGGKKPDAQQVEHEAGWDADLAEKRVN